MDFAQMGKMMELAKKVDLTKVMQLAETVDLGEVMAAVSSMPPDKLKAMLVALKSGGGAASPAELPAPNGDFYSFYSELTDEERAALARVRSFMEETVRPAINAAWSADETPRELLIDGFRTLGVTRLIFNEDGSRTPRASLLEGFLTVEMARVDVSTATFFGVHAGLALWSIVLGGSEAQKAEWVPKMLSMDVIGAFGLTEKYVGSGAAGGLRTTCRREGDEWVINGEKKWIGNSTFSDFTVIYARDEADQKTKGFIVRKGTPGYSVKKIEGKIALRAVENGEITLENCRVAESDRLQNVTEWRVVADILRATRAGVAWQGVGCQIGAYETALAYTQQRRQFGKPIAGFQLVQEKLVQMLANTTASFAMCVRLSHMQDAGQMADEHASLAKVFTAARCRDTVALARETLGGNGILLEHHVARFFSDTEAIYSYEGTNEVNSLVVGRAITGFSAFV